MRILVLVAVVFPACWGALPGVTPFCDICACFNQTTSNPDVDCSNKLVKYTLYTNDNWFDAQANETYPIRSMNLQFTNLRDLNDTFPNSTVQILDLSNNAIQNVADGVFKNLQDMVELILSHNDISLLSPHAFMGLHTDGYDYPLRSLRVLRLDYNKIHTLDNDVFQHIDREIQVLSISHNPIKKIDLQTNIALTSIIFLTELDLSYTEIAELPEHFLHTPKELVKLDLTGNQFEKIPRTLEDAHKIEEFIFDNNPINNISGDNNFPEVPTLKTLHICHMPNLVEIGANALSGLHNLDELHITNNIALTTIHASALVRKDVENFVWPPLKKLHLENNKLSRLNSSLLAKWSGLTQLDIRGNPWTCECENQWMVDELTPIYLTINETQAKQVACGAPIEMEGQTLHDIYTKKSLMRCLDMYGHRPERDGAILVGVLIGVLIGIPLVLFVIYSYQRNWYGLFDNSPAAYSRQFYRSPSNQEEF